MGLGGLGLQQRLAVNDIQTPDEVVVKRDPDNKKHNFIVNFLQESQVCIVVDQHGARI